MWECEHERKRESDSVFETDFNLLKFARTRIESASAMRESRAGARDILENCVTKLWTHIAVGMHVLDESGILYNSNALHDFVVHSMIRSISLIESKPLSLLYLLNEPFITRDVYRIS